MWIEKNDNVTYKAVERYTDIMTGRQKKVSITMNKNTAKSRKEAQAALMRKIERKQLKKTAPEKLTLEKLIEEHRSYQEKNVRPGNVHLQ